VIKPLQITSPEATFGQGDWSMSVIGIYRQATPKLQFPRDQGTLGSDRNHD
jgi:hypothetical protein